MANAGLNCSISPNTVDRSVVEIYANDRQAIGRRVYPTRPDSLSTSLFASGGSARFRAIRAWEMMPSNPY